MTVFSIYVMIYIADNLKKLRKSKDYTQEDVSEMLSVSPQSVNKWERGDTMPDITLLPAIANLYKVTILIKIIRIVQKPLKILLSHYAR